MSGIKTDFLSQKPKSHQGRKRKREDETSAGQKSGKSKTSNRVTKYKQSTNEDAELSPTKNNESLQKPHIESEVAISSSTVEQNNQSKSKTRFIAFIGNLPYTATTESVTKHFAKIRPTSIRHLAPKSSDPASKSSKLKKGVKPTSKGFAFLEFDTYDRMRTCLKLYHHSTFDDGVSEARKINVELTAGGGGRSQARKDKLRSKNEKLSQQRQRKAKQDIKEGRRKPKTQVTEPTKVNGKLEGSHKVDAEEAEEKEESHIHPSRRKQVRLAG